MIIDYRISNALRAEKTDYDRIVRIRFTVGDKSMIVAEAPKEQFSKRALEIEKEKKMGVDEYTAFSLWLVDVVNGLPTYEELVNKLEKGMTRL